MLTQGEIYNIERNSYINIDGNVDLHIHALVKENQLKTKIIRNQSTQAD